VPTPGRDRDTLYQRGAAYTFVHSVTGGKTVHVRFVHIVGLCYFTLKFSSLSFFDIKDQHLLLNVPLGCYQREGAILKTTDVLTLTLLINKAVNKSDA
jgi:hypothetical protein